jgi:orotate phosphoribosyltransferase
VLVDRQEGGTENLAAAGVKLHAVFVGDDFR